AEVFELGAHDAELQNLLEDHRNDLKSIMAFQITWAFANAFVKLSICHLYVTIFSKLRLFRIATFTVMGMSIAYAVVVVLETLLVCSPIAFNRDRIVRGGTCSTQIKAYEAVGILNLLIDIAIIILPMPCLWKMQLPVSKRLGLTAVFGIGIVTCAISVVRIVAVTSWDFSDFSYGLGKVAYWSILEPALGVMNCCLPVLPPVFSKLSGTCTWIYGRSMSSYGNSKRLGDVKTGRMRRFRTLDDGNYPLTDASIANGIVPSEVDGGRVRPSRKGSITVQHEWVVEYEPA
ncbi:hypothetical protein MMC12_007607, partial [Toensbergia leucococca]|nr:hypothetical protein [Toensbergia leucococca]